MLFKTVEVTYKKPSEAKRRLQKMATRKLMDLHRKARACGGEWDEGFMTFNSNDIKAELATREHVPNKKEGEVIRRIKAQGPKKEGKGRRRR